MEPYYQTKNCTIFNGDCRTILAELETNSVDAIVTDPPYELGFMGKAWDRSGIANDVAMWAECLRVLKPGGHLLSFGGSRTYHRMACAIEDGGFEIRDQIMWLYGSGFPKSLDVSKAIDKAAGVEDQREFKCLNPADRPGNSGSGVMGETATTGNGWRKPVRPDKTLAYSDTAKQWDGWGTALKPAHEPIVVARKPLIGTVAANVMQHGTGALNIDGCRVGNGEDKIGGGCAGVSKLYEGGITVRNPVDFSVGRWPANVILSYPEDEYELRSDVSESDRKKLYRWLSENA